MDKKYIKNLQGKEFVLFEGLLNEFHANGGKKITTEMLQCNETVIFKATVSGSKGEFTGHGDANKNNVGSMVFKHMIRLAETRGIARALRFYTNMGMCSVEELTESKEIKKKESDNETNKCKDCDKDVSDAEEEFSIRHFKKSLCRKCQKNY